MRRPLISLALCGLVAGASALAGCGWMMALAGYPPEPLRKAAPVDHDTTALAEASLR